MTLPNESSSNEGRERLGHKSGDEILASVQGEGNFIRVDVLIGGHWRALEVSQEVLRRAGAESVEQLVFYKLPHGAFDVRFAHGGRRAQIMAAHVQMVAAVDE